MTKDITSFNEAKNELLKKIDKAFDSVTLWNGIWPNEAWAIDDFLDKESPDYKKRYDLDERNDRRKIVDYFEFIYEGILYTGNKSDCKIFPIAYSHRWVFSNNAESRRFLLPSYMTETLKTMQYTNDIEQQETDDDFFSDTILNALDVNYGNSFLDTYKKLFALLTTSQKEILIEFLDFQLQNVWDTKKETIKRNIEFIKKLI